MGEVATVDAEVQVLSGSPSLPQLSALLGRQQNNIGGVSAHIEVQRAIAEVQTAVLAAMSVPRDEQIAREKLLKACQCLPLAKRGLFNEGKGVKRGSNTVIGASVHLAKEIARVWRNIDYAVIEHIATEEESEYEAVAWDKESNVKSFVRFKVKPIRYSNGDRLTQPQEIYENAANISARRLRSVILALIPNYIVEEAVEACKATIAASIKDVEEDKAKMLTGFAKHLVTKVDLERYCEKEWAAFGRDDIVELQGIYSALRSGESKPSDFFVASAVEAQQLPKPAPSKPDAKPPEKPAKPAGKPDPKSQKTAAPADTTSESQCSTNQAPASAKSTAGSKTVDAGKTPGSEGSPSSSTKTDSGQETNELPPLDDGQDILFKT